MKIGSLFSGSGQLDEGVRSVLGGTVAWHAEIDPAACKVLAHRYPDVPNLGDVSAVDWTGVEPVDVLTGGFPCQDVSHAGARRGMRAGTRSGLWSVMADAIDALRPPLVVIENVRGLLSAEADSALEPCAGCVGDGDDGAVLRALGRVLGDLADVGYDARWHGLRAADVGAPHGRFRVFVVATDARHRDDAERPRTSRRLSGERSPVGTVARGGRAALADALSGGRARRAPDARGYEIRRAAARTGAGVAADAGSRSLARPAIVGDGLCVVTERSDVAPTDTDTTGWREQCGSVATLTEHSTAQRRSDATADAAQCIGQDEPISRDTAGLDVGAVVGAGRGDRAGDVAARVHELGRTAAVVATTTDADGLRREGVGRVLDLGRDTDGRRSEDIAWGQYEPAIRRWESVLGRRAPAPTERGPKGGQRLSPRLTEWMMGWPDGWVTDVPRVSRNDALKLCGNGVVPQQAAEALRRMLGAGEVAA